MALSRTQAKNLPPDAIVLNEEQAVKYQMKILKTWDNPWDVVSFNYGSYVLGFSTLLSSLYLNNYFRIKLKLGHYGRLSSYLTVCVLPSVFSVLFHQEVVLKDVILINNETCPICLETRASSLQGLLGCLLPGVFAPFANFALASSYYTYNVPLIREETRQLWQLIKQKYKPLKGTVIGILAFQVLLGSLVTYLEADSVLRVHRKMSILEKQVEMEIL